MTNIPENLSRIIQDSLREAETVPAFDLAARAAFVESKVREALESLPQTIVHQPVPNPVVDPEAAANKAWRRTAETVLVNVTVNNQPAVDFINTVAVVASSLQAENPLASPEGLVAPELNNG